MARPPWRVHAALPDLLLVARDPKVIAAAHDAASRLPEAAAVALVSGEEALSRLIGPGAPPRHLVLEGGLAQGALLTAARDRFTGTDVVVVTRPGEAPPSGLRGAPAEGGRLAAALGAPVRSGALPNSEPADLAAGLARGEITVRFQPIVRLADRRPLAVEALARWERPELALGAGAFVPMAERAGLAGALTLAVARRAIAAFVEARGRRALMLSFNVPLYVLLCPDLPSRLRAILDEARMVPEHLLLELTESTEVRDAGALRRALLRLRRVGFGVLLDDFGLDDARHALLDLPFAGLKLDRSVIAALPHERRARALVERLIRHAGHDGRPVVAEGVSSPVLWRCAASLGCDLAQGFGVGRPMQPEALPAWIAAWASLPRGDQPA